jgi:hypothetical protein
MASAQPMPPPQSANKVKAAIAAAAGSGDSHRIVQQQHQRRAGFAGGEGVEGQAGCDGDLFEMGVKVISDAHPVFDRPLVRAVRKQLQTIALLSLAHFDYERAGVSQFVSQFVSHFRLHPFALTVNLQDAPDTSAKVIRARTRSSFP